MPTRSLTSSLLLLTADAPTLPWGSATWSNLTRIPGEPWAYDDKNDDNTLSPNVPEWTVGLAKQVKSFVTTVFALGAPDKRDEHVTNKSSDNDTAGRTAWASFVGKRSASWGLNKVIDEVLEENGRSPAAVYRAMGTNDSLPHADTAQIYQLQDKVAASMFGEDAFIDNTSMLKPAVVTFVKTLLTTSWNRYRKNVKRDVRLMDAGYHEVTQLWDAFSANDAKPTARSIRAFLTELRKLVKLYQLYDNKERRERVQKYMSDMVDMLKVVRNEPGTESTTRLPKAVRDALTQLASEDDIKQVTRDLLLSIEDLVAGDDDERLDLDLDPQIHLEWKEGVETLASFTEDEMWMKLGLPEKKLPFFQHWTDPDGTIDPWSEEGQAWLKDDTNTTRQPLRPRWHQLVGIYRTVERAFERKPVLLMDGLGLGKTLQVLGAIACLVYYRRVYETKGHFPGDFHGRKFDGVNANIPDLPHIIVTPVNLRAQWESEIKRFLVPAAFDLFPYVGRHEHRATWWTDLFDQSKQSMSQRIVLATQTSVQDDAGLVFEVSAFKEKVGLAIRNARFQNKSKDTVYGRDYGFAVMDEAHSARKHNQVHRAFRGLRERCLALVAMTATPVTTKAQDLFVMGQWMGVPGFDDFPEFILLNKEINRASRQDSKTLREAGINANIIRGVFIGVRNPNTPELQSPKTTTLWMGKIRERFAHYVIRRTIDSIDFAGNKLFGMRPYTEHVLRLKMYDWETGNLRKFAKDLVKENPAASADTRKNFYIEFRRSMLHPSLNPKNGSHWTKPESMDHWKDPSNTTVKLDVLAQVVQQHLERNGRVPLTIGEDGRTLIDEPNGVADDAEYAEVDRIIIYSAFPSSNQAIVDILHLYGIESMELHGSLSLKKRQEALNSFRASTAQNGPRVLILSNVGMVGLNLACANVMVFVDTTWSAQDDEQLRGRIFRYPQMKQVRFYRLIALDTPDVFLNNISFDKGQLHAAFVGCSEEIKDLFERPTPDNDDALLSVTDVGSDGDAPDSDSDTPKKPRGKGKGRGGKAGGKHDGTAGAKSKAKVDPSVESDADVEMFDLEPIVGGLEGKRKPRPRATKSSNKRPASATSPKKVTQASKRTRQNTITQDSACLADGAPPVSLPSTTSSAPPASAATPLVSDEHMTAAERARDNHSVPPIAAFVPPLAPDEPPAMHVDEPTPSSHVSSTMQVDEPLTATNAAVTLAQSSSTDLPSAREDSAASQQEEPRMIIDESDPWQDEERALAVLRGDASDAQLPQANTSPLSSPPATSAPQSDSEAPRNTAYSIPHREPASGSSSVVPQFRTGARAGSLGQNKDGNGSRRRGRGAAPRKNSAKRSRM